MGNTTSKQPEKEKQTWTESVRKMVWGDTTTYTSEPKKNTSNSKKNKPKPNKSNFKKNKRKQNDSSEEQEVSSTKRIKDESSDESSEEQEDSTKEPVVTLVKKSNSSTLSNLRKDVVALANDKLIVGKYNTSEISEIPINEITDLIKDKMISELTRSLGADIRQDSICRVCTIVIKENEQDNNLLDFYIVPVTSLGTIGKYKDVRSIDHYEGTWTSKMLNPKNMDEEGQIILNYVLDICKSSLALTGKNPIFPITFGFEYYRGRNLRYLPTIFHKDSPGINVGFPRSNLHYNGIIYLTDKPYTYSTQLKVEDKPSTINMVVKNGETMIFSEQDLWHGTPSYDLVSDDRYNLKQVNVGETGSIYTEDSVILTQNPKSKKDQKVIKDLNDSILRTKGSNIKSVEIRDLIRYYLYENKKNEDNEDLILINTISKTDLLDYLNKVEEKADIFDFDVTENGNRIKPDDVSFVLKGLEPYSLGGKSRRRIRKKVVKRKTKKREQKGGGVYKMPESFLIYLKE